MTCFRPSLTAALRILSRSHLLPLFVAATLSGGGACRNPGSVVTQHNDMMRTGAYMRERTLTPDAVSTRGMRIAYWRPVDGTIQAQPLYVPRVRIGWRKHDVVYVATLNNTVYAYDAAEERDSGTTRGLLWSSHLPPVPYPQLSLAWGIGGTPTIDRENHTMYVVYGIQNGLFPPNGVGDGTFDAAWHLAALDIRTGSVLRDVTISGSVPSSVAPGHAVFAARRQWQRAALLLTTDPKNATGSSVWVAFASRWREETHNWHGWVMRYDAATFAPRGVFCTTPDRRADNEGGGVWEGGGGPAADADGNAYFLTGNGPAGPNSFGNSIVKLTPYRHPTGAYGFHVAAFSAALDDPSHAAEWANNDIDLGSGGVTVIPRSSRVVGGGKTGVFYLMDFSSGLAKIQEFIAFTNTYDPPSRYPGWIGGPHLHGSPTYWEVSVDSGFLYDWGEQDSLRRFTYDRHAGLVKTARPSVGEIRALQLMMPGGMISLSANGTNDGVLWATLPESGIPGRFLAIDATTMRTLWETAVPSLGHFIPPTVVDGRVFVVTSSGQFRVYKLARRRVQHPPPPGPLTTPWYRIPPGDPAPRVQALLRRLGSGTKQIEPQGEQRVLFTAAGTGVLIYTARPTPTGGPKLEWVLNRAEDYLIDDIGLQPNMGFEGRGDTIATFRGGTTWVARDSSSVVTAVAASVDAPDSGAAPWLLLIARAGRDEGLFSHVTHIQRLGTTGGVPKQPAAGARPGAELRVPYSAIYVFYEAGQ